MPNEESPDLRIENHGSVALLVPVSTAGRAWVDENVHSEPWQWLGGSLAVEPRMMEAIVDGAQGDGLSVSYG